MTEIERLIEAIERNTETLDRFIESHSELTGILTRSEEMRSLRRERAETVRGTPESNRKILQIRESA